VLLDASATNSDPEKKAYASIGLRGFDVIETIKDRLESMYPGVVSCADILAFAARDAASFLSGGHIEYSVPSGRLDGVVSRARDAQDTIPASTSSFSDLEKNFGDKNFTVEELVVLSGAHSIGVANYQSFKDRLAAPQSEIDAKYQYALRKATKSRSVVANDIRDETVSFKSDAEYHPTAPCSPRGSLDNTFYHNALDNRVLFKSDWALRTNDFAEVKLKEYRDKPSEWNSAFAAAMVKLSKLPAEGNHFEIRKKCSATNKHY
jgi:peroxidase